MKVGVYEYLSGGGALSLPVDAQGELLRQGLAMRDAMLADLRRVPGCTVAAAPLVAGVDPRQAVQQLAARHDRVWVVAPESDGLLLALCRAVPAERWLGCDAASIGVASSKRDTLAHLRAAGAATPHDAEGLATAWIVKPDDGVGALGGRRHATRAAAEADRAERRRAGLEAVLEPWVDGEALSLSLVCARGTARLLAVNRQRLHVDAGGLLHYDGVEPHAVRDERVAPLRELAAIVARALPGLGGYVGVDLVWHPTLGPVLVEVNPRVTSAYVGLSAALGANVAAEVLAAAGAIDD